MDTSHRRARILVIVGLAAMLIGVIDPLEGSIVILAGAVLVAVGAGLARSPHRTSQYVSLLLVAIGVAALWGVSVMGGFGGSTGRSSWWALLMLPYPIGWLLGVVGALRELRDRRRDALGQPGAR
ncbi:MAG TPA: hypothetical protein VK886_10830 [Vicinamibacterales bacterium]|nr:hypothetical protein [Vicinamibacterales bacterium]